MPKGKDFTGRYYRDVILKKLSKYYQKRRPVTGFPYVCLLHNNAPAHTSDIVKQFLKSEKVIVLLQPTYSPDLTPLRFFSFFQNQNSCYLVVDLAPGKLLAQPSASVSEVYQISLP